MSSTRLLAMPKREASSSPATVPALVTPYHQLPDSYL
jgi:hypothetical protein